MIEKDILKILTNLDKLESKLAKFIKEFQDEKRKEKKVKTCEETPKRRRKNVPKRKKGRPKFVEETEEMN
jgi:hypothetical protein